jgi:GntR family transcriptional regulator/MocR family aminotransferase
MQVKRRQELLSWAAAAPDRFILEDDYDSEFRYRGAPIEPIFAMDTSGKVIYMNTFSKTLIPSLRISFMVLPPALVERYRKTLSFYSGTVSSIEQYTLAHFIREGYYERHINHMRNYFKSIRDTLIRALEASSIRDMITIIEPSAGTHFLLKINTEKSDRQLTKDILKMDIEVAAFSEYLLTQTHDTHTLVINYCGIHRDRIEETVKRLAHAVKA